VAGEGFSAPTNRGCRPTSCPDVDQSMPRFGRIMQSRTGGEVCQLLGYEPQFIESTHPARLARGRAPLASGPGRILDARSATGCCQVRTKGGHQGCWWFHRSD
jgi:hypothetical protein